MVPAVKTRPIDPPQAAAADDEAALLQALSAMLRDKRQALMQGDMSAQALAPLWQPLLDRLARFAERRADGGVAPPGAVLQAQAQALRQEYDGLLHTLTVWSDAMRQARDQAARRPLDPVYGQAAAPAARRSLGRG